jgi:hypothetical protein
MHPLRQAIRRPGVRRPLQLSVRSAALGAALSVAVARLLRLPFPRRFRGANNDRNRTRSKGGDIGNPFAGLPQGMREEQIDVLCHTRHHGRHFGIWRGGRLRSAFESRLCEKLCHRRPSAIAFVQVVDFPGWPHDGVGDPAAIPSPAVRARRACEHGRMAHGEGEPDQRAATAAENICRLFTDRREQQVRIVGMDLGPPRLGRSIESASRIASRIVRDERIALSKHRRDASEHVGVSGAARNREQHRARPRTW